MAIASDIVAQGILTGGGVVDVLRTAAGTEYLTATFRNYSANSGTLDVYVNGAADQNHIFSTELLVGEVLVVYQKLGSTDTFRAEAGNATSISYTLEQDSI